MPGEGQLEILIDIRARLDELSKASKGIADTTKEANSLGAAFKTGLGIDIARRGVDLITRSFHESVVAAFQMAGAIKDQAENLQISTEAYQVLGNVLVDAGGNVELLSQVISTNNRSLAEARDISSGAAAAYRRLGLESAQLEGLPIEQRMQAIGRAVDEAKDQTVAFGAASQILGSRNLPITLGALRSLATDGYDTLSQKAKAAGLVMEEQTIQTLDRAQKQIEKFKRALAISTGQAIASALDTDPSLVADTAGFLLRRVGDFAKFGRGIGSFFGNTVNAITTGNIVTLGEIAAEEQRAAQLVERAEAIKQAAIKKTQAAAADRDQKLQASLQLAENQLKIHQAEAQFSQSNPFLTEDERRVKRILDLRTEIDRRRELIRAIEAMRDSTANNETPQQTAAKVAEQNAAINAAQTLIKAGDNGTRRVGNDGESTSLSLLQARSANYNREDPNANPSYLTTGEGLEAGRLDWANQLGSRGEQVAAAMQSTIGATVNAISEGIYGWITGTQSFGDVLRSLGATILQTMLQTIVQMGVQWVISAALAKASMLGISALGFGLRKAETADVVAQESTKAVPIMANAAGSSISSFGVAALLGIAALMAVMAAFGGFADGGFTGSGGKYEPAGLVHRGEVVFSQSDVAAWGGAAALENVRVGGPAAVRSMSGASLGISRDTISGGIEGSRKQRDIVVVGSMLEARNLQRDPAWESFILDVVGRNKGELLST